MNLYEYEYANARRVTYTGGACFIPVCEKCKRFVVEDNVIVTDGNDDLVDQPNATCSRCGRTKMLFEGFF